MKAKVPKVHPKKPTIQPWKIQRKRNQEGSEAFNGLL